MDSADVSQVVIPDGFIDFVYEKPSFNPSQQQSKSDPAPAGDTNSPEAAVEAADRVLGPEESITVTLGRVSSFLEQALAAIEANQDEQGCVHLEEAANLLEILVAAVVPNAGKQEVERIESEAPKAIAAAA